MKKLTPAEFEDIFGIKIYDPDGWRVDETDYDKELTIYEFLNRLGPSTVKYNKEFINMFLKE